MERRKLSDLFGEQDRERLAQAFDKTQAATDLVPLPAGEYIAHVVEGTFVVAKTGTRGYKLTFQVLEGEHTGRRVWQDLWLTPAAMPMTKRDLAKLGVTSLGQLDQPLPRGIRCRVQLALRRDDGGREHNRVRSFEVIGIDRPERDPFAPAAEEGIAA